MSRVEQALIQYQSAISSARVAFYDGIVEGRPFAKTVRGVINDARNFGRWQAEEPSFDFAMLSTEYEINLTDSMSVDERQIHADVAMIGLGKMFSGDMNGMITFIVDTAIRYGFAIERLNISLKDRNLAETFDAIVENMKLTGDTMVPDAAAVAFLETLERAEAYLAIQYMRRLFNEEKLTLNVKLPEFKAFIYKYGNHILD